MEECIWSIFGPGVFLVRNAEYGVRNEKSEFRIPKSEIG
jgi:hypothetical protein